ncbi:MAG: glycosyltransferase family 2 protein [Candidatus Komeilibacteria bacterium]|nr:glycosyltransferase family 2 protein [Candidatus Komeilibacteria bacterium]
MELKTKNYYKYRLLESVPGILVWATLILAVLVSVWQPLWAIYFIIIFDLYWFIRVSYMLIYLFISWRRYHQESRQNWLSKLSEIKDKDWREYHHLVFLPTYKEPFEVVEQTFKSLTQSLYPLDKMVIILAGEEADRVNFEQVAARIQKEFGYTFSKLITTLHPANVPGEMPGKGSNIHYAGHRAKEYVDTMGWTYEEVIVSAFDIDTKVHPQYFSYLTYQYLTADDPTRYSYQPLAFYHNNVWESNLVTRVVSNATTFWLLTDLARSERLFTFSSHSMSFKALVDVGFWQNDIVTEDSRIFLQCFIYYNGNYRVKPMYIPVSMNTVYMGKFWRSLLNQYKQMRRWAWGVEHFPYMAWNFYKNKKMPLVKKVRYLWNQTEGVYSWATAPIIIFLLGRLPLYFADKTEQSTYIAQQAPFILEFLMTISMLGLIITAVFSTLLLPPRPLKYHWSIYLVMIGQWIVFPITMIFFGSIPAIEAQTRLMLGGRFRLGFWVTEKKGSID